MTPKLRILEAVRFRLSALEEAPGSPYNASLISISLRDLDDLIAHEKKMEEAWRFSLGGISND
jgi:hypothetical protein